MKAPIQVEFDNRLLGADGRRAGVRAVRARAQGGLASWREVLLRSPRLLQESALARVRRTESVGLSVKRVPLASSALSLDGEKPLAPVASGFMHGDLHGDNILLHFARDAPSGFSVIDLGNAAAKGCALYDWVKLCVSLVEAQYSTPAWMALPQRRAAEWCGELARRRLGGDAGKKRWRPGEDAALAAAPHLRNGLAPDSATGTDLVKALFLNSFFALRHVSFRNTARDDPSVVRNTVLHAAADAFARTNLKS